MKIHATLAAAGAAVSAAVMAFAAGAAEPQAAPPAHLTMVQAEAIALEAAPGDVVDSEYENEDGAWRYSFDIRQGDRIHEIGVDADTGAIVEDSYESLPDKD